MLAVSTTSALRLFRLRSKAGSLKVQKLEAPSDIIKLGAKAVHISPDRRWLAIVRIDNSVRLCRITKIEDSKTYPQLLPGLIHLKRLPRDPPQMKYQYGTLGPYNRSITCLAFSADSRVLVVGDLSGFLDTWVLEGHEDLTQDPDGGQINAYSAVTSDDDSSDEENDEEQHATVIFGQHWIRNPSASLLIKLPASPLVLSFRPSSTQSPPALTNGSLGVHPTRHTPHPHSHDLPHGEDRLLALTAENQMYEFNVLSGRLSDWSRRNPTSSLPREFRNIRDRAMGALWDVRNNNERIWVYGVTWLWMFDLSKDLPAPDDQDSKTLVTTGEHETKQLKRKRPSSSDDDESTARSRYDTGAGSKIARSRLGLGIGPEVRKIKGAEKDKGQLINLAPEQSLASDEEDDLVLANEDDPVSQSLRSNELEERQLQQSYEDGQQDVDGEASASEKTGLRRRKGSERPSQWHTYKYRPILGIVLIGGETDDEAAAEEEDGADDGLPSGLEVALVERPLWEVALPPQYYGNQEWDP